MRDSVITGIFAFGGIVVGTVISWITSNLRSKQDRKDRYAFALLERRFDANQEAFYYAERMKSVVHGDDNKRMQVLNEGHAWFIKNNLYLSPEVREKFQNTILDVDFYKHKLDDFRETIRSEGPDSEKTKRKRNELEDTFKGIMKGLQKGIQDDVDLYYRYLKKDKSS